MFGSVQRRLAPVVWMVVIAMLPENTLAARRSTAPGLQGKRGETAYPLRRYRRS
jgi:hypothetical protein